MSTDSSSDSDHLSKITTNWTAVFSATNRDSMDERDDAQRELMLRYAGAIYRYLLVAVNDSNVADDLAQEFALRLVAGNFRNANPERGRFRDYIKQSLRNLVTDHFRRLKKQPTSLLPEMTAMMDETESDDMFDQSWRREILLKTWKAMDQEDQRLQTCYAVVLKARSQFPALQSAGLAELLSKEFDRPISAAWSRQTVRRARARFSTLLRREIRQTIGSDSKDDIDDEMGKLGLSKYNV